MSELRISDLEVVRVRDAVEALVDRIRDLTPRVLKGDWRDVEAALDALPMGAQIRWTTGEPIHVALGINRGAYWNVTTHGGPLSSYNIARDETPIEVIA
ncbi:hypothetical protein [Rhodococcoides fascians]|uniref:hypothetical protein n=1 Tax=Rhodococcoides fascians TaxID=1828 RepID=UPI0012D2F4AA|nr:hypothetical protein [Rhodococcus fascians]